MVDYVRLAATAKRLIEKNGREVIFLKENRDPATPSQPWKGPDQAAEPVAVEGGDSVTAKAVFVPARGTGFGRDSSTRAEPMLKDVVQFALVASTSMPEGTDLAAFNYLRDGAQVWTVHFTGELNPGGNSLVWEVGVGR